jgi:Putative peptidoglycan binding domain
MVLQSQRFTGVSTLERCVTEGDRLMAGEPDSVAVTRLQDALVDLGYLPLTEVDGIFGDHTGKAVTAYKTDNDLIPNDPVVGHETMTALDDWFASEPSNPDDPDASTDGLLDLAEEARTSAKSWAVAARDALIQWPEPPPDAVDLDPERLFYERALEWSFKLYTEPDQRETLIRVALLPMAEGVIRLLDGAVTFLAQDRPAMLEQSKTYEAMSQMPGVVVVVTPPFRNHLDAVARAGELYRQMAHVAYPVAQVRGWPGMTRRWNGLNAWQQVRNSVAYATFAYEAATGMEPQFRPEPIWY